MKYQRLPCAVNASRLLVALFACLTLFTAECVAAQAITVASYSRDGKPFPLGVALQAEARGLKIELLPTSGGVENIKAIRDGRAQVAFVNAAVAYEASWGLAAFSDAAIRVRAVSALYPHNLHVVVRADSAITSLRQLSGKRVSVGAKGSGSEQISIRLLESLGLKANVAYTAVNQSVGESVAALQAGSVDAFIFGSPAPVDAIAKLANAISVRFLSSAAEVEALNLRYGRMYAPGQIPANTYAGQSTAIPTLDVWDLLVVSETLSADIAYKVAKLVDASREKLLAVQPSMRFGVRERFANLSPIAFHLGAQSYFAEQGIAPFNRLFRDGAINKRDAPGQR